MTQTVESPCTRVCRIDPETGLCAGCLRTLEEIASWAGYSEDEKRAVILALEGRRPLARSSRTVS
ncbi:MAG: DUF1289 domain-containing protein [Arenicellales bacterium]